MAMMNRSLRRQIIDQLDHIRRQQQREPLPPRLLAALVRTFAHLFTASPHPAPHPSTIDLGWQRLHHRQLQRILIAIRAPDQSFYPAALKSLLLARQIRLLDMQTGLLPASAESGAGQQMLIALHLPATAVRDPAQLAAEIEATLVATALSVADFAAMQTAVGDSLHRIAAEQEEEAALLGWLLDERFIFLGLRTEAGKTLGVLRNRQLLERIAPGLRRQLQALPPATAPGVQWLILPAAQHYLFGSERLEVVRVSRRNRQGELISQLILGRLSRSASYENSSRLPLLRRQWQAIQGQPPLARSAYYRHELRTLFDRLPKPLLLASDWQQLLPALQLLAHADDGRAIIALLTPQPGWLSLLLVALPTQRCESTTAATLAATLRDAGVLAIGSQQQELGALTLHLFTCIGALPPLPTLQERLRAALATWRDRARLHLLQQRAPDLPAALEALDRLPPLYRQLFPPEQFADDLAARIALLRSGRAQVRMAPGEQIEIHLFLPLPRPLGELVATIHNFGLIAMQEAVVEMGGDDEMACLCSLRCRGNTPPPADAARLIDALEAVFNDEADDDPLNALVLPARLAIGEVQLLIVLRNYLIQLLPDAAPLPLSRMLLAHPLASVRLWHLFEAVQRPMMPTTMLAQAQLAFEQALDTVSNLSEDRWFRALGELAIASLRCNLWQRRTGEPVALKIDPARLSYLPSPRPWREIFVHGVHVEGVHLRAGRVARGGIRHSDRPDDYRTEVLELMVTQVTKNGQIVPTGAKGGFVVRGGGNRPFVLAQYRLYIAALLSLTDNLHSGEVVPPAGMRIDPADANDPYLVVAADKGTATFSDTANEISLAAGFWLGDAFASGGAHGYDHKKLGITARGAWECAAHHFAGLGRDLWHDPIRCVGIGDMSGDVFGNGMLLNPNLQLLAAFNHRHIFLDPEPTAAAFAERRRLFAEGRDWDGFNPALISPGGGVFARDAKQIALAPNLCAALGIAASSLSGQELIRALLTAPVDLLYNGGIGCYVKGSGESQQAARDPHNNAVRVDGRDLRAAVVSEGGNLGFTQAGRLEFAARGGLIDTDAIDNSAGVDLSDHEVNLKILFAAVGRERLPLPQRNRLMAHLADEISARCTDDNRMQARALSIAELAGRHDRQPLLMLAQMLRRQGRIDPARDSAIEDEATLALRPQLALLLGQEKSRLREELGSSDIAQWSHADALLFDYFPPRLHRRFKDAIAAHPLRHTIVASMAVNRVVNHFGPTAVWQLQQATGLESRQVVPALLDVERLLGSSALREAIWREAVDRPTALILLARLNGWLLRFCDEYLRLHPQGLTNARLLLWQRTMARVIARATIDAKPESGLTPAAAAHVSALEWLAHGTAAIHLCETHTIGAERALAALQAALQLLPIVEIEEQLRAGSADDGEGAALRREWLAKLTRLKSRATLRLAMAAGNDPLAAGMALWSRHKQWPLLRELKQGSAAQRRAGDRSIAAAPLMLALARLDSLIDED